MKGTAIDVLPAAWMSYPPIDTPLLIATVEGIDDRGRRRWPNATPPR
jgi:hypothetical protein